MKTIRTSGFTLIELMITVLIVGITLSIAVPGMRQFMQNERLTSFTNTLISDLMLARSEAVGLNQPVTLCASSDQTTCNSNDYQDGWIILSDLDNDGAIDDLIRVQQAIRGGITFALDNPILATITYDSRGFTPDLTGTITISDNRGAPNANTLTINRTGRVSR